MDEVYKNAIAARDRLRAELQEVDTFLKLYEKYATRTNQEHSEANNSVAKLSVALPGATHRHSNGRRAKPSELV